MDIPSDKNTKNKPKSSDVSSVPTNTASDTDSTSALDSVDNFALGDNGEKLKFNPNETISTSDKSSVGGYTRIKEAVPVDLRPDLPIAPMGSEETSSLTPPGSEETSSLTPPEQPQVNRESDFIITDPAKMDFIKTYTKEFDDLVEASTHAVESILTSIDTTVREHTNDIVIPDDALQFIDGDKPKDNKVSKFDEAQAIVHSIMDKASEAKKQGEEAAMEASRVYDSIQQFKKDTQAEIASIRNRDEFGRPKNGGDAAAGSEMPVIRHGL